MAKNKVIYNGNTLIDLTADTVDAAHLASGYTAHDKAGNQITGTMAGGGATTGTKTATGGGSTSIAFTGLAAQPKMFSVVVAGQFTNSATRTIVAVMSDGTTTNGVWEYQAKQNGWGITYVSSTYFSWTYSNGTLTIRASSSTNGGVFRSGTTYKLDYVY